MPPQRKGRAVPGKLVSTTTKSNHEKSDGARNLDSKKPSLKANHTPWGPRRTSPEPIGPEDELPEKQREAKGTSLRTASSLNNYASTWRQSIFTLLCILASWLHLSTGLSRDATKRHAQDLQDSNHDGDTPWKQPLTLPSFDLPSDVRTAMKALSIEPTLTRSVCCPKCMSRYEISNLPDRCYFRQTSRSRICDEPLWTTRNTRHGSCRVPRRLYSTQEPDSFLQYFLSKPGIEDHIEESYRHQRNSHRMRSIWDSPAWKSLGNFTTTVGNLTFSFYIDWFNPGGNKIAEKHSSCGAIMMFCLNLPYELQHLPENTYFVGITPPPKEPTLTSLTFLTQLWHDLNICIVPPGYWGPTSLAKVLGFAGVGSKQHFCSFCLLHKDDIEELDISKFIPRDGTDAKIAAQDWHDATLQKERKAIFTKNGVRWTALHLLSYRDPVRHTVLGLMHNWIEGILQHHVRVYWGIGISTVDSEKKSAQKGMTAKDDESDTTSTVQASSADNAAPFPQSSYVMELDEEIDALRRDSAFGGDVDMDAGSDGASVTGTTDGGDSVTESETELGDDEDESDIDEEDETPSPQVFTTCEMQFLREGLADIVTPSYLARLPTNFGEKSHGKLKADQWLVAFGIFFPLILPELWSSDGTKRKLDLLDNLEHLVACTNIVCAHSVTNEEADRYTNLPNHHYAMHNGPLMKFWGPLIKLSEYPYETHNGMLQRINTNYHPWELDLTMLRSACRRGRLEGTIREGSVLGTNMLLSSALDILSNSFEADVKGNTSNLDTSSSTHSDAVSRFYGTGKLEALPDDVYDKILSHLQAYDAGSNYRHRSLVPHPAGANVLSHFAKKKRQITWKTRLYSKRTVHPGNSSISYMSNDDQTVGAGFIEEIFQQVLGNEIRTFLVVAPHHPLSEQHQIMTPYATRPGFQAVVVYDSDHLEHGEERVVIEPRSIIGHVAYRHRPAGTFGIPIPTLILVNSLHRDRYLD
ncbi:hypothetical protein NMY22_g15575 [Coprinellus aureogranulatus]|nr:hypothetical protein NMY22_g15575 [Coprinellus aureogranulatus]